MRPVWIYYVTDIDLFTYPFDDELFMSVTMGAGYKEGRDGPTYTTMSLIPHEDIYRLKDIQGIEKELIREMSKFDASRIQIVWDDESTKKAMKILSKVREEK